MPSQADTWASSTQRTVMVGPEQPRTPQKISFQCESCGTTIKAPPDATGRKGACPKCAKEIVVPHPDSCRRIDELTFVIDSMMGAVRATEQARFLSQADNFRLPKYERWFPWVFGKEKGQKMVAEYTNQMGKLGLSLYDFFQKMAVQRKRDIRIRRVERNGKNVHPHLRRVLNAMQEPVVLYGVYFFSPGEPRDTGILLSPFVYVKDQFRFLGPLRSLDEPVETSNAAAKDSSQETPAN